jgi:hypothetical protein
MGLGERGAAIKWRQIQDCPGWANDHALRRVGKLRGVRNGTVVRAGEYKSHHPRFYVSHSTSHTVMWIFPSVPRHR